VSYGKVAENFSARLQSAARNGTGYLEVHDALRERRGWIFLEDQEVVAVLVDGYQPRLARRLTASELVSVADMGEVLSVTKDEYDPRIAVECVSRGLVDAVTMKILYREFMLSAASFMDEWELGDSQWVAGVPPWEGRSTAVAVPLLVNALSRRKEHWASLWTELSAVTVPDRIPVRTGRADYRPDSADEAAVLRSVDGQRTLDQVAGECGFTRFQTGHLMAGLMTKKVLDLFPVQRRRSTDRQPMRVEAGYYPISEPVPPQAHPESTHENTQVAVVDPVAAQDPEGNVVTHEVEVEDAAGVIRGGQAPCGDGPVAPECSGTVAEVSWEPDLGAGVPGWDEPAETSQAATDLGDFFVNRALPSEAVRDVPPVTEAVQQSLPRLPAMTGRPSDFHATVGSTLPRGRGGLPITAVAGSPVEEPVEEPAAPHEPVASNVTAPGTWAEQSPMPDAEKDAAVGQDVERDTEVTRLRDHLLRLAAQRKTAVEHAAVLHEQAVLHSTEADAAAVLVEETGKSIARLTTVTSQASATAVSQFEGLLLAQQEDSRIAVLRAQVDEDAEKARRALVMGKRRFDESSAAHANLERDLSAEVARGEAVRGEWAAATDGAVRSAAEARNAEAVAAECDNLIEEARKRLTEMANAGL